MASTKLTAYVLLQNFPFSSQHANVTATLNVKMKTTQASVSNATTIPRARNVSSARSILSGTRPARMTRQEDVNLVPSIVTPTRKFASREKSISRLMTW